MKQIEFVWDPIKNTSNIKNIKYHLMRQKRLSHCYKEKDDVIRIISARKATKKEKETYERW